MNMRIIHFSCVAPPDTGGIGRVASLEVASLAERGHDAHLVSLTTHAGFRIGNVGTIHAIEHFVREADIVHLHYPFYGVAGMLARLRREGVIKHLVMTLHMDATAPGWRDLAANIHRRFFQPRILASADALLVSSRDYAEHASYREVASRAVELPFGVDEALFSPGAPDRAKFHLPEDAFVVLFVGGMDKAHEFKGVPVLLDAIATVPDAHLLLVGEGDRRSTYEKHAERIGVTDRCHFAGKLDQQSLITAYRSSNVLALTSTSGAEAFGLVLLEAQSCGIPVIASDLPGVRTVVDPEKTGFLVPPGNAAALADAIRRVQQDAVWQALARERSRVFVLGRFTWREHMDGLEAEYNTLMSRRPS